MQSHSEEGDFVLFVCRDQQKNFESRGLGDSWWRAFCGCRVGEESERVDIAVVAVFVMKEAINQHVPVVLVTHPRRVVSAVGLVRGEENREKRHRGKARLKLGRSDKRVKTQKGKERDLWQSSGGRQKEGMSGAGAALTMEGEDSWCLCDIW